MAASKVEQCESGRIGALETGVRSNYLRGFESLLLRQGAQRAPVKPSGALAKPFRYSGHYPAIAGASALELGTAIVTLTLRVSNRADLGLCPRPRVQTPAAPCRDFY